MLATGLVLVAAAGCAAMPFGIFRSYPPVGIAPSHLLGPDGDTIWTRTVGVVTVASPVRAALDSPFVALASAGRMHLRLLGGQPAAVTAAMLRAPRRGQPEPSRVALPAALTERPVVWGWYVAEDTTWGRPEPILDPVSDPTPRRIGPSRRLWPGMVLTSLRASPLPPSDGLSTVVRSGDQFPVEYYVAQHWVDAYTAGRAPLPVWLHAAVVSMLAGGDEQLRLRAFADRGVRDAPPLDSLFARSCAPNWRPVPGEPPPAGLPVSAQRPDNLMWAPWLRDRCGYHLRVQAASLLAFMVDRAGDGVVRVLLDDAQAAVPLETTLRRFPSLPSTVAELDVAWREWVVRGE